jgi:NADPH:quinone reductase-like Zn-dependent oxidoreductase
MRITGGEGVDLVIDALGPASFRKDYRLLRSGGRMVMFGLSDASKSGARNVPAALRSLLAMPLATMPWWKSLSMMNENKGVFGLNMLSWWDREGNLARVTAPLLAGLEAGTVEPVVAEAFPFDKAGEAHEFIAQRRNVGKVVLFP